VQHPLQRCPCDGGAISAVVVVRVRLGHQRRKLLPEVVGLLHQSQKHLLELEMLLHQMLMPLLEFVPVRLLP
jgi:hypothetical protein